MPYLIRTPNRIFSGNRADVVFLRGKGYTEDAIAAAYCRDTLGYAVTEIDALPASKGLTELTDDLDALIDAGLIADTLHTAAQTAADVASSVQHAAATVSEAAGHIHDAAQSIADATESQNVTDEGRPAGESVTRPKKRK